MLKGTLEFYFETGMEGFEFAFQEEGKEGYDGLNILEEGDRLKIYDNRRLVYEGIIKKDTKVNLTDKTGYPYPRQVVGSYIVHWFQEGIDPLKWTNWFIDCNEAELEKKVQE